jgi:hypothetical protein
MEQQGSQWTDCHEISYISENLLKKFNFNQNLTRIMGTLPKDPCTFMITSPVLLKMQNFADKGRGENQNKIRAIYGILWKKTVKPEATDYAIWRTCIACWTTTATDTQIIWNAYCSFMARVVTRMRLTVTFISTLPFPIRTSYSVVSSTPV